jgi:hypothetical protein
VWGGLVVLGNGLGYMLLEEVPAPAAMFNIVNHVNVRESRL